MSKIEFHDVFDTPMIDHRGKKMKRGKVYQKRENQFEMFDLKEVCL